MISRIKKNFSNPLFSGSLIMILGSTGVNFLNYLFHLTMARLFHPEYYGVLATLISLIGLLSIVPTSLGLVITKFVSSSKDERQIGEIVNFFQKKIIITGIFIFLLLSLSSSFVSSYLKIDNSSLVIISAAFFIFSIPSIFNRSVLQGLLKFRELVISMLTENIAKLFTAIFLVLIGLSIIGGISSLVVGSAMGWLVALVAVRKYPYSNNRGKGSLSLKSMFFYSLPVTVQSLAFTSLYSTDVILVKHFFSSHQSGIYAATSLLSRIIFYGSSPIAQVMFPLVSSKQNRGEEYSQVFRLSFLATLMICLGVILIYLIIPKVLIFVSFGTEYLELSQLLFYFSIFMSLFSLSYLLVNFYLSLGKTKIALFPAVAAIFQVIGIYLYHDSLLAVVLVSLVNSLLLLIALMLSLAYVNIFFKPHTNS